MVQLPDELSHKTKQNLITHNITRGHLLRNNKKYPLPPSPKKFIFIYHILSLQIASTVSW